jgi:hypothetical protein
MNKKTVEHNIHTEEQQVSKQSSEELRSTILEELPTDDNIIENDTIIIHKMKKPDDAVSLHKTLENIFG